MIKLIVAALWSLICLCLALIPEGGAYLIWNLVDPSTDVAKVLLVAVFLFCGLGLSFFAALGSFALWAAGLSAMNF